MLRGGRTDRTDACDVRRYIHTVKDVTYCKRRYIHTGRKPTSAWGLRKGAVAAAEERFRVCEDDGRGDGGGVMAAERAGCASGSAIEGSIARTPRFGEAV